MTGNLPLTTAAPSIAGSKPQQFTISAIDTIFDFYKPQPPLSKFVDNLWLYKELGAEKKVERILPTGTLEVAINLSQNELRFHAPETAKGGTRFSGAIVSGAHRSGLIPDAPGDIFLIGV